MVRFIETVLLEHLPGQHDQKAHAGGRGLDGDELPPEPGTTPVPPRHVRGYHYTTDSAALDSILDQGLSTEFSRGHTYGEPDVIWFSAEKPINDKPYVEVHVPVEQIGIGGSWKFEDRVRDKVTPEEVQADIDRMHDIGSNFTVNVDRVPPSQIVTFSTPAVTYARAYLERFPPGTDKAAKALTDGTFNGMRDWPDYGEAIAYWERRVRSKLTEAGLIEHLAGRHDQKTHGRAGTLGAPDSVGSVSAKTRQKIDARAQALGLESPEELAARMGRIYDNASPRAIEQGMTWYSDVHDMAKGLASEHGFTLEQTSAVIARTSPTRNWAGNEAVAREIIGVVGRNEPFEITAEMAATLRTPLKNGPGMYRPSDLAPDQLSFVHPSFKPRQIAQTWGIPGKDVASQDHYRQIQAGIEVLRGTKSPGDVLSGPKTRSFYNNIYDPTDPRSVTVDDWMYRSMLGPSGTLGGKSVTEFGYGQVGQTMTTSPTVKGEYPSGNGMYPYFSDAIVIGAADRGILPQQFQAIVWEAARESGLRESTSTATSTVLESGQEDEMTLDPYRWTEPTQDNEDPEGLFGSPNVVPDPRSTETLLEHRQGQHDQKKHGRAGGESNIERTADTATDRLYSDGGVSLRTSGKVPTEGYMVSFSAKDGRNRVVDFKSMERSEVHEVVLDHIRSNRDFVMAEPDRYFGGWVDSDTGKLHLDVSQNFPVGQLEVALQAGRDRNQIAIFDLQTFEEIPTGGTGE